MAKKYYTIQDNEITLYIQPDNTGEGFKTLGISVKRGEENIEETVYVSHEGEYFLNDKKTVLMDTFLKDTLVTLADAELNAYMTAHIGDYGLYTKKDSRNHLIFWTERNLSAPAPESHKRLRASVCMEEILDGIIRLHINGRVCSYNFLENKFVECRKEYGHDLCDFSPLDIIYGDDLDRLIAIKQHQMGTAHPAYEEILRLNQFLHGKKSVKLVMKDGGTHTLKPHNDRFVSAGDVICYETLRVSKVFQLRGGFDLSPKFDRERCLLELDHIRFGKDRHIIDENAMNLTGWKRVDSEGENGN